MSDLIAAHLARLRASGLSPNTIRDRDKLLRRLDTDLPEGVEGATEDELEIWLGQDGWSQKTRNTYFTHIAGFYRWATSGRRPHLDYDPTTDMEPPRFSRRLPKPLDDNEVDHAASHLRGYRRHAFLLALGTGMRCAELARAQGRHLTDAGMRIIGKGDKERLVPACPEVAELVAELGQGLLIRHPHEDAWVPKQLSMAMSSAFTAIGLPEVTIHRARHTFATRLVRAGARVEVVQQLLGHSNLATTQGYLAVAGDDLEEAIAKMPPLIGGGKGRRVPGKSAPAPHASTQQDAA